MEEGQLDGVADGLDLVGEAADLREGRVGHLLEDEVGDLRALDLLEDQLGLEVDEHVIAGVQRDIGQGPGAAQHALVVGGHLHQHAGIGEVLEDGHETPGVLARRGLDHDEGLVQAQLVAGHQRLEVEVGARGQAQAAPVVEHVHGGALGTAQERRVRVGRISDALEIRLHLHDLRPRRAQARDQAVVLGRELLELGGHVLVGLHASPSRRR